MAREFYERERLLPPARRTASGDRLYGEDEAGRVRFIRRAQSMTTAFPLYSVYLFWGGLRRRGRGHS